MRHSSIEQALALLERDEDSEPPDDHFYRRAAPARATVAA
jgi:hypothetical protein